MEISPEIIVKKEHVPRNSKELYLSLLGVDRLPVTPEDMPRKVFLHNSSFGDLERAIMSSHTDGLERSQSVTWDGKLGYKKSQVFLGNNTDIGNKAVDYFLLRAF